MNFSVERPLPWVLDVEASGFGAGSYPIEVGFAAPDGRTRCSLIRPEPQWTHWDARAEAVHCVAREQLLSHGRSSAEVAALLNLELAGQQVYCNSWAHDYVWLARLFDAAGVVQRFRLRDLRELLSDAELACFDAARTVVQARAALTRHRASADALVLQLTIAAVRGAAQQ
jgi:hypothetical protein